MSEDGREESMGRPGEEREGGPEDRMRDIRAPMRENVGLSVGSGQRKVRVCLRWLIGRSRSNTPE